MGSYFILCEHEKATLQIFVESAKDAVWLRTLNSSHGIPAPNLLIQMEKRKNSQEIWLNGAQWQVKKSA
jgi:hypothetical protein